MLIEFQKKKLHATSHHIFISYIFENYVYVPTISLQSDYKLIGTFFFLKTDRFILQKFYDTLCDYKYSYLQLHNFS